MYNPHDLAFLRKCSRKYRSPPWYSAFALRNAVRQPFILFRGLCDATRNGNVFQWSLQPKSRSDSRHAPSTPILIQDIPACFASRRFLKRRLTADIRLSAFFFSPPPPPPAVMLLFLARCTFRAYEDPVVKSERGRAIFPKRDSVRADDPRKEIKSAKVYRYISKMYASGRTVKKSKLDLTISWVQQICSRSLIWVTYCYIPKELTWYDILNFNVLLGKSVFFNFFQIIYIYTSLILFSKYPTP